MTTLALLLALSPATDPLPAVAPPAAEPEPTPAEAFALDAALLGPVQEGAPIVRPGFQYTFAEVSYGISNGDGAFGDSEALGLRGSLEMADSVFLLASVSHGEADLPGGGDAEGDSFQLGGGLHLPISDPIDFVFNASYLYSDTDVGPYNNGYALEAGVRAWAAEPVEVGASVQYVDVEGTGGDDFVLTAAARWYLDANWSLGVGYSHADDADVDSLGFNLRYGF